MQPWTRFGPYAIGIALGMIMYRTKCKVRMPKVYNISTHLLVVLFCNSQYACACVRIYIHI